MGRLAGKHAIEHSAQGVDIGGGGLRRAADLLGTRIFGRQQTILGLGLVGCGVQYLGDTEIQQLRFALGAYQYVGRFQVAMNDQVAMSVRNRFTNFEEQLKLAGQVEFLGIFVDGNAIDIVQRQV